MAYILFGMLSRNYGTIFYRNSGKGVSLDNFKGPIEKWDIMLVDAVFADNTYFLDSRVYRMDHTYLCYVHVLF